MVSADAVAVELLFARLRRFPVTSRWLASSSGAWAPHVTRLRLYLFPLPPGTTRCLGTRRDMLSPIGNGFSKAVIISELYADQGKYEGSLTPSPEDQETYPQRKERK